MKRITSNRAPIAIGPYVHATISRNFVFVSGQLGINPKDNKLGKTFEEQAKLSLQNLKHILEDSGSDLHHVLKTTIYLADLNNFQKMNQLYTDVFQSEVSARTAIQISKLPMNAEVEIEAIAEIK